MRHTIICTITVDIDCEDPARVEDAVLSHITDMQGQQYESATVLPDGSEVGQWSGVFSVVSAETEMTTTTAGWAAN